MKLKGFLRLLPEDQELNIIDFNTGDVYLHEVMPEEVKINGAVKSVFTCGKDILIIAID